MLNKYELFGDGTRDEAVADQAMVVTNWFEAEHALDAFTKSVSMLGKKACAVEVRNSRKELRLLFDQPKHREPAGLMRVGDLFMPMYVHDNGAKEAPYECPLPL